MGLADRLTKIIVQKVLGNTISHTVTPFITNPKINVDPRLIRKIKNDPSLYSNSDFIEQTLNRYPGLTLETLRRIVEES